jgi:hypothetical protein
MNINLLAARVYHNILDRCYRETNHAYKNYGGRGIYVHDEWLTNPTSFFQWYGKNYFEKGQVDRIDVNGPYSLSNCRIITAKENSRNRRNTIYMTAFGETKSLGHWAEDSKCAKGVTRDVLYIRYIDCNWSGENCILTPVSEIKGQSPFAPKYKGFGEEKTLHEWFTDSRCIIKSKTNLSARLVAGWTVEKAIIMPVNRNAGINIQGKSILQWSKDPQCQVSYKVLKSRLEKGIELELALQE